MFPAEPLGEERETRMSGREGIELRNGKAGTRPQVPAPGPSLLASRGQEGQLRHHGRPNVVMATCWPHRHPTNLEHTCPSYSPGLPPTPHQPSAPTSTLTPPCPLTTPPPSFRATHMPCLVTSPPHRLGLRLRCGLLVPGVSSEKRRPHHS